MNYKFLSLSRHRFLGFKEFPEFKKPELFDFISIDEHLKNALPFDENVLKYLKSGYKLSGYRGFDRDLLNSEKIVFGTYSQYTDGYWVWHEYIIYYYENYNISLPGNFLETVKKNNFFIPEFSDLQKDELSRQLKEILS